MFERAERGDRAVILHPLFKTTGPDALDEFQELARSAGAEIAGVVTAPRPVRKRMVPSRATAPGGSGSPCTSTRPPTGSSTGGSGSGTTSSTTGGTGSSTTGGGAGVGVGVGATTGPP